MTFNNLIVTHIIHETPDTVSLHFELPQDIVDNYNFIPGQYLTLSIDINGEEVRRAYSICTNPESGKIGVAVKKINGGKMSSFVHDNIKIGDTIKVSTPEGKFVVKTEDKKRNHFFITAGSGITPIMSMIPYLLEEESLSNCYLLYGSRDEDHIIFKSALDALEKKYAGQFFVEYSLSKPKKSKGKFGLFKTTSWRGEKGRIDNSKIIAFLASHKDNGSDSIYYLCGPGDLIENTENLLINREIKANQILTEHFTTKTSTESETDNVSSGDEIVPAKVIVHLEGEKIEFQTDGKKTILDEILDLKKNPPYSCTSGACSSCMAKVVQGSVKMDACYALDDSELENNFILTCQAHPTSSIVEIIYE